MVAEHSHFSSPAHVAVQASSRSMIGARPPLREDGKEELTLRLPPACPGCARIGMPTIDHPTTSSGASPSGDIVNSSNRRIWITAGNRRYCLGPGESSDSAGIDDADGLLLDGTSVLFDSVRSDLGGGQVHRDGAIKVCDLGTLTVRDAPTVDPELVVTVSTPGFICPGDSAGYKTTDWCMQHSGWDISTAPISRQCP